LGKYDEALSELDNVEQHFKGKAAKDVQTGLRCKLALRQGDWREAEQFYAVLHNKELPVHKSLHAELLRQKAIDSALSSQDRKIASEESQALMKEIAATGATFTFGDTDDSDDLD
jgi:hypothetical protein